MGSVLASLQETMKACPTKVWMGVGRLPGSQQGMVQFPWASESREAITTQRPIVTRH